MKIALITSLFSGFKQSVLEKNWSPTGAPTIYKLINKLDDSSHQLGIYFIDKETGKSSNELKLDGLNNPVNIVKAIKHRALLSSYFELLSDILVFLKIFFKTYNHDIGLYYFDRANLVAAGLFARLTKKRVVLRVMGINTSLKYLYKSKWHPCLKIKKWLLKSNFSAIICTQDGSGGEIWLGRLFDKKVPKYLLLNGVEKKSAFVNKCNIIVSNKVNILFLGRLEEGKGILEFMSVVLGLSMKLDGTLFRIIIVGDGSKRGWLEKRIKYFSEIEVNYMPYVSHEEIYNVYKFSDIYISFNDMGNLSNSNLEAISNGCCVFIPELNIYDGRDAVTDELLPKDIVFRYADMSELIENIVSIVNDKIKLERIKKSTLEFSENNFLSWDERMSYELSLLNNIALNNTKVKPGFSVQTNY